MIPGDWVGREIDGRYLVEAVIGVGGMGTVLRAKHKFTGVPMAVKVLRSELQLDPEVQARFLAEAQAPNWIGHPAIVKVLDAGRMPEGTLYMAMELLVGRSLRVAMTRRELPADQVLRIMLDLLTVLGHAHAKGFVHRDLKPDNVFLCAPNSEVKLLDFGIAKMLDVRRGNTVAGDLLGTPAYMAPEQLADASNVDARADLWAVGVMLYEMVALRLPLQGTTQAELLAAVAAGRTTPIRTYVPHVSREVEQFFERALAPDPRRRFGAAVELAQALGSLALPISHAQPAQPAMGHLSTAAAGATVASVAAAAQVPTPMAPSAFRPQPASMAPPVVASQPMPMTPAPRSKRTILIGVVAALLLATAVLFVAVSRTTGKPTVASDATETRAPDPAPEKVITEVVREPDARTEEIDRDILTLIDAGARQIDDAPKTPVVSDRKTECKIACAAVLQRCNTTWGNCEQACLADPAHLACLRRSLADCRVGAMCSTGVICGGTIAGGAATCGQVAACEGRCRNDDIPCGCACIAHLDPSHILELARLNACVFRCNHQEACVVRNCQSQFAACQAR